MKLSQLMEVISDLTSIFFYVTFFAAVIMAMIPIGIMIWMGMVVVSLAMLIYFSLPAPQIRATPQSAKCSNILS